MHTQKRITKTDHFLGHKTNIHKVKKKKQPKIIQKIFSQNNGIKLEISKRKIPGKASDILICMKTYQNLWDAVYVVLIKKFTE